MADSTNWLQLGVTLAGGGVAGAILTNIVNHWKARRQPVRYSIERERVFRSKHEHPDFTAKLSITSNGHVSEFDNLVIFKVVIANTGNKDLDKFSFGVTASEGTRAIWAEAHGIDRHHVITVSDDPQPTDPKPLIDFECRPFHRADAYTVKLYLVSVANNAEASTIIISSPEPVRFVEAQSAQLQEFNAELLDALVRRMPGGEVARVLLRFLR